MCAIIDNNVVAQAFGSKLTPAGKAFRESVDDGKLLLVVGGELLDELGQNGAFEKWRSVAVQYGKVHTVKREAAESLTSKLRASNKCASDDEHVIALAQLSGARLLFSNDDDLQNDFKSRRLINNPRGKVYSTLETSTFTRTHSHLLNNSECRSNP